MTTKKNRSSERETKKGRIKVGKLQKKEITAQAMKKVKGGFNLQQIQQTQIQKAAQDEDKR